MTLTKTDRARVIQSVGDGTVRRSAKSSTTSPPRSGWGLGVKEPTAPKASRNTVPNPGGMASLLAVPRVAKLFNPHDSRQRISRLSHR